MRLISSKHTFYSIIFLGDSFHLLKFAFSTKSRCTGNTEVLSQYSNSIKKICFFYHFLKLAIPDSGINIAISCFVLQIGTLLNFFQIGLISLSLNLMNLCEVLQNTAMPPCLPIYCLQDSQLFSVLLHTNNISFEVSWRICGAYPSFMLSFSCVTFIGSVDKAALCLYPQMQQT